MGKLQTTVKNNARGRPSAETNEKERSLDDDVSDYRNAIGQVDLLSAEQARNRATSIRLPLYKIEEIKRLRRIRRRLAQSLKNEPTLDELAEQMDVDVGRIIELLSTKPETVSLDSPRIWGDDEVPLSEILEDDPGDSPERVVITQTLQ